MPTPKRSAANTMPPAPVLTSAALSRSAGKPLHSQLQAVLRKIIVDDFNPGDAFFTERELESHFGVSKITVRRALDDLSREGLIVRRRGAATTIGSGHRSVPVRTPVFLSDAADGHKANIAIKTAPARRITGILTGDLGNEYGGMLMRELADASLSRGIQVRCYALPAPQSAANLFNNLPANEDGQGYVLFTESEIMRFLNHVLLGRGCRTISIEALALDSPYPYVMTDSRAAVTIGMEHLLSRGHRRIVLLVNEDAQHPTVRVKIERFREIVAERGLEGSALVAVAVGKEKCGTECGYLDAAMSALWSERAELPTALFTVSDAGAWAAMDWLYRQGVDVPGDVSVLGFENVPTSRFTRPALTTVAHPVKEIAARTIDALWSDRYDPDLHELIAPYLVVRKSTGPASA